MTIEQILNYLQMNASDKFKKNIVKLEIPEENTLGVSTTELRKLAKKLPTEKNFLMDLWQTNYHECKLLTILAIKPEECGDKEIYTIMNGINSWDLCDLFCKNVLIKKPNFDDYIKKWLNSEELFYKRASFILIASTSTHSTLSIEEIKKYIKWIENHAEDERLLIKKAVSWSLRELGKINEESKELCICSANYMKNESSKSKQWIAKDALKELNTLVRVNGRKRLISSKSKMGEQVCK